MKLLDYKYLQDFGHEYYFSILKGKHRSFIQFSLGWNDYAGWPYIQVSSGTGRLFSLVFWVYRLGIDIDIIGYNWPSKYDD
jgi:hypothetical protein